MTDRKRIYLSSPHLSGDEARLVQEAFDSNWVAPLGPHVDAFEQEMAQYLGVRSALALSSGTAALHLAARLLGFGPGDRIFCPSLTFVASIAPFVHMGAHPTFLDSEPETWNLSPRALETALADAQREGRLPKAVLLVDLYGQACSMDPLLEICHRFGVPVLEDAAEALGASYRERRCGSFGVLSVLSFNGNKIITTSGGGMLLSDQDEPIGRARFWSTQARDKAPWYQHSELGYNYRLSNVLAAIGRGQMLHLEERVQARRRVFSRYQEALGDLPWVRFMPEPEGFRSNRWLTTLTLGPDCPTGPLEILQALQEEDIEARPVWKPMHLQPVFADAPYYPHEPGSDVSRQLFDRGLCLPSGSNLSEEDQDRVLDILRRCLAR